eukprot:TRINITY_DN2030_c0_g1_i1.p1 TRINITY_DN2030_c0_g1~~TRINITY_DN2030_c0_g1_i1.p1  ORF type:complete len:127 (-),score=27.83 TRINITY_DN2030_c0_g1_i1:117-497(-)
MQDVLEPIHEISEISVSHEEIPSPYVVVPLEEYKNSLSPTENRTHSAQKEKEQVVYNEQGMVMKQKETAKVESNSPESISEEVLKKKYGGLPSKQGLLLKRLESRSKKFDSADYQMEAQLKVKMVL